MARIVICEFIDERALPALRAKHEVLYDAKLVDDAPRLKAEVATAEVPKESSEKAKEPPEKKAGKGKR